MFDLSIKIGAWSNFIRNPSARPTLPFLPSTSWILEQFIAAGSPEWVVRLWDLRFGKWVSKLVGHTGTIRALLRPEDGKYVS